MVRLNRIYTRTGDAGTTGLADGSRRPKTDPLLAAIGDVDEANSALGLAVLAARADERAAGIADELARIQNDLFDLGADLATPGEVEGALRVTPGQVERLERVIDEWNERLRPLTSFVLPGGGPAAAALHLARAVARRAERSAVAADGASATARAYLNRLSDLLFVAARLANDDGASDILWVPGKSR